MNLGARVMKLVELQGSTRDENEDDELIIYSSSSDLVIKLT